MGFSFEKMFGLGSNKVREPKQEAPKSQEHGPGEEVEEILVFLRHGDRYSEKVIRDVAVTPSNPEGKDLIVDKGGLKESGRLQAREVGRELLKRLKEVHGDEPSRHDSDIEVHAVGSQQGPKQHFAAAEASGKEALELGRAAETAHIVAHIVAGDRALPTEAETEGNEEYGIRPSQSFVSSALNFGTIISPEEKPDFQSVFDAVKPANYKDLTPAEQVQIDNEAHRAGVKHVMEQQGPKAEAYRKEAAGAVAYIVNAYRERASERAAHTRRLDILGTHGLMVEMLLKEAMVQDDGTVGFKNLDELGGAFLPSEGWFVRIRRDEHGVEQNLEVVFLGKSGLSEESKGKTFTLDKRKVEELSKFYEKLHTPKVEEESERMAA